MNEPLKDIILKATEASDCYPMEKIQNLWSGYGVIQRYGLKGSKISSVILKHVCFSQKGEHPRGWNNSFSHQRKLKSYKHEIAWYKKYSQLCSERCRVPRHLASEEKKDEFFILLEDLDASGFQVRKKSLTAQEMRVCLKWLAHFHGIFMGKSPEGLWPVGTYWHLETRPDELKALKDRDLRSVATQIDQKLKASPFQTFVHGDAKLANFCFSEDLSRVAAVDFQYVGGGCGMKDVAYFIGSCLGEEDCEHFEKELLDYYFSVLVNVLKAMHSDIDIKALEKDWRSLYPVAWTDFHRFLKGWSPGHWKINSYSERLARDVIEGL